MVRYTQRARDDLEDIFDYIAKDNPDAARRVRQAVFDAIQIVASRPYAGIKNARAIDLRSKLVTRYPTGFTIASTMAISGSCMFAIPRGARG